MSAAVTAPAGAVEEAHLVLHMAMAAEWPAENTAEGEAVCAAVVRLGLVLRARGRQADDTEAAHEAASAADHLIRVMTEYCGPDWALQGELAAGRLDVLALEAITAGRDTGTEDAERGTR